MTIDERVEDMVKTAPELRHFRIFLTNKLLEVARDQREACAEAVLTATDKELTKDGVHQIVMNAEIK